MKPAVVIQSTAAPLSPLDAAIEIGAVVDREKIEKVYLSVRDRAVGLLIKLKCPEDLAMDIFHDVFTSWLEKVMAGVRSKNPKAYILQGCKQHWYRRLRDDSRLKGIVDALNEKYKGRFE